MTITLTTDQIRSEINSAIRRYDDDIGQFVRKTPVLKVSGASLGIQCAEIWLKLEHLQVGGSFKARGAYNRLTAQNLPAAGVTIASGGNAGIATAAAAQYLGVACEVFLPEVSSQAKRTRLRELGATVHVVGAAYSQALEACVAHQISSGALMSHAYDQLDIVAGAGTVAFEIEAANGLPDSCLVSVGGGGLIAGIAAQWANRVKVVALEPELAPTLHTALAAGQPVDVAVSGIAADSLGAKRIGNICWGVAQTAIDSSLLLPDAAIRAAQLTLWQEFKLAVEPAAALGLAALQTGVYAPAAGEKVCLVICGANIDPASLNG